jgi:hypothetical protein
MTKLYLLTSLLAISFFSFAQYRGMSIYTGGGAQHLAGGGPGGYSRSSVLSHK